MAASSLLLASLLCSAHLLVLVASEFHASSRAKGLLSDRKNSSHHSHSRSYSHYKLEGRVLCQSCSNKLFGIPDARLVVSCDGESYGSSTDEDGAFLVYLTLSGKTTCQLSVLPESLPSSCAESRSHANFEISVPGTQDLVPLLFTPEKCKHRHRHKHQRHHHKHRYRTHEHHHHHRRQHHHRHHHHSSPPPPPPQLPFPPPVSAPAPSPSPAPAPAPEVATDAPAPAPGPTSFAKVKFSHHRNHSHKHLPRHQIHHHNKSDHHLSPPSPDSYPLPGYLPQPPSGDSGDDVPGLAAPPPDDDSSAAAATPPADDDSPGMYHCYLISGRCSTSRPGR